MKSGMKLPPMLDKQQPRPAPVSARAPRPPLRLRFSQASPARRRLRDQKRLQNTLQEIWGEYDQPAAEVEVNVVGIDEICRLHQEYLGDPSPTDIITFDLGFAPDRSRLAALYICAEVAERHAPR